VVERVVDDGRVSGTASRRRWIVRRVAAATALSYAVVVGAVLVARAQDWEFGEVTVDGDARLDDIALDGPPTRSPTDSPSGCATRVVTVSSSCSTSDLRRPFGSTSGPTRAKGRRRSTASMTTC
jgi:hypothetical protein